MSKARREWTKTFLENGGFNYILGVFKTKTISSEAVNSLNERFELKSLSFMTTLMRVFMTAAFSAGDKSQNVDQAIALVRKSSSVPDEETLSKKSSTSKGEIDSSIKKLMTDQFGREILDGVNFNEI